MCIFRKHIHTVDRRYNYPAIQYSHWAFVYESYKHNVMKCFKLQEIDYFILYFKFKIFMAICIYRKFIYVKEIHNCLCKSVWINLFIYFPWKSSFTTGPSVVKKNMMPRRVIDLTTKNRLTSIKLNHPRMHWYFLIV